MSDFLARIKGNNQSHQIDAEKLQPMLNLAQDTFVKHFSPEIYFERSIFINWTCAIADCKYCFLSTIPKYNPGKGTKAIRSQASILAEALVCRAMGWKIGYLTGGLRVETPQYLIDLAQKMEAVINQKTTLNFGPYSRPAIEQYRPHILGMGAAIESFDEELHSFICPSKPLPSLLRFLGDLQELQLQKLITIILGIGERQEEVYIAVENIKKYNIEKVQLCFLKPQAGTIFNEIPSPDPYYMAWWIANIRIACPKVIITIALVRSQLPNLALYLRAGANNVTRFLVFKYFGSSLARDLEQQCAQAGRTLRGHFMTLPVVDIPSLVDNLPFPAFQKAKILYKAEQYYQKLKKVEARNKISCPV